MDTFQINPQQFAVLLSSYTISAGVSGLAFVVVADRFDRRRVLLAAFMFFIVGTLACAVAPSHSFLLGARSLTGVFGGIIGSTVMSIVGDLFPQAIRGRAVGIVSMGFSLASILGVPISLLAAHILDWHAPFVLVALIGIGVWVGLYLTLPPVDQHLRLRQNVSLFRSYDFLVDPAAQRALLFVATVVFSHFLVIPFLSPSMITNVGFEEVDLSWIYFFGGLITVVTSPLFGKWSDLYGRGHVYRMAALAFCLPVIGITQLGPTPLPWVLVLTTFFFVCMNGRMVPALAIATSAVPPQVRGSYMSFNTCVVNFTSGSASFVAGQIVQHDSSGQLVNYPLIGLFSCVIGAVSIYLSTRTLAQF